MVVEVGTVGAPGLPDILGKDLFLVSPEELAAEHPVAHQQTESAEQADQVKDSLQELPPAVVYMLSCQRRPSKALTRMTWIKGQKMIARKARKT